MTKRRLDAWKRLGVGIAASALTLVVFAIGAIAVVSAPTPSEEPDSQQIWAAYEQSKLSRLAASLDASTPTLHPTPDPTPEPTPQPTPEPAPVPVTEAPAAPRSVPQPAAAPAPAHGYRNDVAQALYTLLNNARAANGVAAVASNSVLTASAEYYAKLHFTTANPYELNHYLDGGPGNRAWARGYCCAVGEILVTSEGSAEGMVELWMSSPSHHAVIVDPQYREAGISCYGGEYTSPDGSTSHPVLCSADFGSGG